MYPVTLKRAAMTPGIVDGVKGENQQANAGGDAEVNALPPLAGLGAVVFGLHAEKIDADGGGQGGQQNRRTRRRPRVPEKQDGQGPSHAGFEGDGGEQQIGACHGDPGGLGVQEKQGAQPEEQQVDEDQDHRKCAHVELRIAQGAAARVLLHHVLVNPVMHNAMKAPATIA